MNPSARCSLENSLDITGSFLLWKSQQPDLPCSFVNTDENYQDVGFVDYINFAWKPGFRIEACWETSFDGWDVSANYTWMDNESKGHSGKRTNPDISSFNFLSDYRGDHFPYPIFNTILGSSSFETNIENIGFITSSYKWKMKYNMFDLQLGKPYLVSPKLALTPFIGGLGGWIKRDLFKVFSNLPFVNLEQDIHSTSNYWGVGPRIGFNSKWNLGAGFGFAGNFASALLYGATYGEHTTSMSFIDGDFIETSNLFSDITRKHAKTRFVPAVQLMLGISWDRCFNWNCHDYFVDFSASWEVNYYWNMQDFLSVQGIQSAYVLPTSLELGGLTASGTFGF